MTSYINACTYLSLPFPDNEITLKILILLKPFEIIITIIKILIMFINYFMSINNLKVIINKQT